MLLILLMQRELILTKDGSHTVSIPEMHVTYHSVHGAIQESLHVFIHAGLYPAIEIFPSAVISIFEMGFGTGLNALLTLSEAEKLKQHIDYYALELFPLEQSQVQQLNYCQQLNTAELEPLFKMMHDANWEQEVSVSPHFKLQKSRSDLLHLHTGKRFHLVYFDAFAPSAQPELWSKEIFEKLYAILVPGGVLVTYCSKGDVRRAMQAAGFIVEKIPGPPGKREMVRGRREARGKH